MSKLFRACVLLLILGSCGARDSSAPRNLDNACSILTERPHYVRAFKQAERNFGVETHVLMAMIYQESKFISDNRPPHQYALGVIPTGRQSSALGYSQALDGTWQEYVDQRGGRGSSRTVSQVPLNRPYLKNKQRVPVGARCLHLSHWVGVLVSPIAHFALNVEQDVRHAPVVTVVVVPSLV